MPDFAKALRGIERGQTGTMGSDPRWQRELSYFRRSLSREGSDPIVPVCPRSCLPSGEILSNSCGSYYITRAAYSHDYFHGRVRLSRLSSPDLEFLMQLMREKGITPDRE